MSKESSRRPRFALKTYRFSPYFTRMDRNRNPKRKRAPSPDIELGLMSTQQPMPQANQAPIIAAQEIKEGEISSEEDRVKWSPTRETRITMPAASTPGNELEYMSGNMGQDMELKEGHSLLRSPLDNVAQQPKQKQQQLLVPLPPLCQPTRALLQNLYYGIVLVCFSCLTLTLILYTVSGMISGQEHNAMNHTLQIMRAMLPMVNTMGGIGMFQHLTTRDQQQQHQGGSHSPGKYPVLPAENPRRVDLAGSVIHLNQDSLRALAAAQSFVNETVLQHGDHHNEIGGNGSHDPTLSLMGPEQYDYSSEEHHRENEESHQNNVSTAYSSTSNFSVQFWDSLLALFPP